MSEKSVIVLDIDGTLTDSVGQHQAAFKQALRSFPFDNLLYLNHDIAFPSPALAKAGDGAVHGDTIMWHDHAFQQAGTASLDRLEQSRPPRTAHRKEESMNDVAHPEIIGSDVSRDWLDLHCVSDGRRLRLRNTDDGHSELAKIAGDREVLVCFEAAGGHEWRLWASLEAAGIEDLWMGHRPESLAAIRRITLNFMRLMDEKLSIRQRFRWAAQIPEYRLKFISRAAKLAPEF